MHRLCCSTYSILFDQRFFSLDFFHGGTLDDWIPVITTFDGVNVSQILIIKVIDSKHPPDLANPKSKAQ